MTKEEAINILESLYNEVYNEDSDGYAYAEAINMAIEALKAESSTEGKYEKAIKTLQEMPKYINSNTIGKKLEVLNHTREIKMEKTNEE